MRLTEMSSKKLDASKRKLLKSAAVGGGAVSLTALPTEWTRPIVASVVLPAHAEQTDVNDSLGSINNCPDENLHTYRNSGSYSECLYPGTYNGSVIESGTYGTCSDDSPFSYKATFTYKLGSGTAYYGIKTDKYCGPTHVGSGQYTWTGTNSGSCGDGATLYSGSKYLSATVCDLLAPQSNATAALKSAMRKSRGKLKGK